MKSQRGQSITGQASYDRRSLRWDNVSFGRYGTYLYTGDKNWAPKGAFSSSCATKLKSAKNNRKKKEQLMWKEIKKVRWRKKILLKS